MKKLNKLRKKRYDLFLGFQSLIASISKKDELSNSLQDWLRKDPLTWMIGSVKDPNTNLSYDTNENILHQKLMEMYFTDKEIKEEIDNQKTRFIKEKYDSIRKRCSKLERRMNGANQRITFLRKEIRKIKEEKENE